MKNSDFQFNNPRLINLNFNLNCEADFEIVNEISIESSFDIQIHEDKNESNRAVVELVVEIKEKNDLFTIDARIGAAFKWNNKFSPEHINILLNQNAPALLVSYLRPIIVNVTHYSPVGSIDIPFINFLSDEKEENNI